MSKATYRDAGVDIDAGNRAVQLMKGAVKSTYGREVLAGIGAFGGLYDGAALKGMTAPVLVASTDGVGTKTKIAAALNRYDSIGHDIVGHCVNDILVQGARPLFFLDYVAFNKLIPERVAAIVTGIAEACKSVSCALLGGETAEMPGVYAEGEFDIVGTIVGAVERGRIIDGSRIAAGDVIIGMASSGLHTNGFSLARKVLAKRDLTAYVPELGRPLGEALLAPHRPYLNELERLWAAGVSVKGMAHITGGGLIENPPRILPQGIAARIRRGSWPMPPLFAMLQRDGNIDPHEMARVFNIGLGMLLFVPAAEAGKALGLLGKDAWAVGEAVKRTGEPVELVDA
jgi:phosphoribosylformylglycinamidine cyclo-ligase